MEVSKGQNFRLKYIFKKKIETKGYGHWAFVARLERFISAEAFYDSWI